MTLARSEEVNALQYSISRRVRPHPKQSPDIGSNVQIFAQGDSIDGMAFLAAGRT
jgi:hypothetical protein